MLLLLPQLPMHQPGGRGLRDQRVSSGGKAPSEMTQEAGEDRVHHPKAGT